MSDPTRGGSKGKPKKRPYNPSDSAKKYFAEMNAGDRSTVFLRFKGDTIGARKAKERADLNAQKALMFSAEAGKAKRDSAKAKGKKGKTK